MELSIKCKSCNSILSFGDMTKQSLKQSARQAFNWKVMLGIQKVEWVPTCENCGCSGKTNFCCPRCNSSEIWSEDILKSGKFIHRCN